MIYRLQGDAGMPFQHNDLCRASSNSTHVRDQGLTTTVISLYFAQRELVLVFITSLQQQQLIGHYAWMSMGLSIMGSIRRHFQYFLAIPSLLPSSIPYTGAF